MPKPKPKLTQEQLITRKQVSLVKSQWSFGQIKTWRDALLKTGYGAGESEYVFNGQSDKPITYAELTGLLDNYTYNREHPYAFPTQSVQQDADSSSYIIDDKLQHEQEGDKNSRKKHEDNKTEEESFTSPLWSVTLFGAQAQAAKQIITGFTIDKKRAQLLRGGVGSGKTYVVGAVLSKLEEMRFVNDTNCLSPWPIVWITRASIVEQTKRVCRDKFGLDVINRVIVVNIEQMRSKFGEFMVECETKVELGQPHLVWKWKKLFHPRVIVVDESQLAKNVNSTQSKIICALADLPPESDCFVLCVSATPFMRVTEAKYFAVNTHKEI